MTQVVRRITVDMSRRSNARVVFATQNDINSRCILIKLTDDGNAYFVPKTLIATVNYSRSDGKSGAAVAKICDDGSIEYTIDLDLISVAGETLCTVSLVSKDGDKLTSSPFTIDVAESLYLGEKVVDSEQHDVLSDLIAQCVKIQNAEADRVTVEQGRVDAEQARVVAEQARSKAEQARASAEEKRRETEAARSSSEMQRDYKESSRIAAEIERAAAFNELKAQMETEYTALTQQFEITIAEAEQAKAQISTDDIVQKVFELLPKGDEVKY